MAAQLWEGGRLKPGCDQTGAGDLGPRRGPGPGPPSTQPSAAAFRGQDPRLTLTPTSPATGLVPRPSSATELQVTVCVTQGHANCFTSQNAPKTRTSLSVTFAVGQSDPRGRQSGSAGLGVALAGFVGQRHGVALSPVGVTAGQVELRWTRAAGDAGSGGARGVGLGGGRGCPEASCPGLCLTPFASIMEPLSLCTAVGLLSTLIHLSIVHPPSIHLSPCRPSIHPPPAFGLC